VRYLCYFAVARFTSAGLLEGPPVLNNESSDVCPGSIRIAAGDRGLTLVSSAHSSDSLLYLRTDAAGTAVGPLHEVVPGGPGSGSHFGAYNTVWADDAFGVIFVYTNRSIADHEIWLRHFVAE
jgi:hypothetical protein